MSVLAVMIGTAQLSALRAPRPPSSRPRPRPRPWGRRLAAKEGISYQPRASGNRKEQQTEENDEDVVARLRSKYTPSLELVGIPRRALAHPDSLTRSLAHSLTRSLALRASFVRQGVEETIDRIMEALRNNNEPYYDFGIEMLYRFAGRHASPFGTIISLYRCIAVSLYRCIVVSLYRCIVVSAIPSSHCRLVVERGALSPGTSFFFGRPLDLGQFERFRRVMNTEKLRILIGHTEFEILSRLDLSETKTIVRWFDVGTRPLCMLVTPNFSPSIDVHVSVQVRTRVANSFTKRETVFQWTLVRCILESTAVHTRPEPCPRSLPRCLPRSLHLRLSLTRALLDRQGTRDRWAGGRRVVLLVPAV